MSPASRPASAALARAMRLRPSSLTTRSLPGNFLNRHARQSHAPLPLSEDFHTSTRRAMAGNIAPEDVSAAAKEEGGTTKGSKSAQMQSEMTKQRQAPDSSTTSTTPEVQSAATKQSNFQTVASQVSSKMSQDPSSITPDDAHTLESREHRATGIRPPSDSLSAEAKRMASANERGGANSTSDAPPPAAKSRAQQSAQDREANFQETAASVGSKMAADPGRVSEEDAALLHSREQRARGTTEKGGVASKAGRLAAENSGATKD